jgi:hypothetical protein
MFLPLPHMPIVLQLILRVAAAQGPHQMQLPILDFPASKPVSQNKPLFFTNFNLGYSVAARENKLRHYLLFFWNLKL